MTCFPICFSQCADAVCNQGVVAMLLRYLANGSTSIRIVRAAHFKIYEQFINECIYTVFEIAKIIEQVVRQYRFH